MTSTDRGAQGGEQRVVWKFVLRQGENFPFMPVGAQMLYVAEQQRDGVLYALCDPSAVREHRRVVVVATGEEFDARGLSPLGLLSIDYGALMFHVFA